MKITSPRSRLGIDLMLTVETVEQALERGATGAGNKGGESMDTALEMASLMTHL